MTLEGHGASSFGMYVLLLPFYFVTIFISFFPWSIKLPWLIRKLWRNREARINALGYRGIAIYAYLLTGIAIVFVIFTLVSTKLPHYTLPAFPLLGLLLARHWSEAVTRRGLSFKTTAIATGCVWTVIALVLPPMAAPFFPACQLFEQSRVSLQPNMQLAAVEFQEPSLVWYFRSRVKSFLTPLNKRSAAEFMTTPGPRSLVLPTPVAQSLFMNAPPDWQSFRTSGFNIAKGKRVDLTLLVKPQ
jgi:hypothetical protein